MMKKLLALLCIVLVAAVSVVGTLAYLTDRESAVNTFTVGNVDITLDEAKVNTDGTPVEGADRVKENEYHLIPGETYTKDPTVTVLKDSEDSYIRTHVIVEDAADVKDVLGQDPTVYLNIDATNWELKGVREDAEKNTITYEYRYIGTKSTGEEGKKIVVKATEDTALEPLFTELTVPGAVTGEDLAKIAEMKISVEGHAIQAATFTDADAAWAAFDAQHNPTTTP